MGVRYSSVMNGNFSALCSRDIWHHANPCLGGCDERLLFLTFSVSPLFLEFQPAKKMETDGMLMIKLYNQKYKMLVMVRFSVIIKMREEIWPIRRTEVF